MDDFEARVLATLREDDRLPPGHPLVVGASGGADSTALLWVLTALGHPIVVAHLHHGIRGKEADEDQEFVRALAARLDAPFASERVDVPGIARAARRSLEEAARSERYAFFVRVGATRGHEIVATGHTMDDQAETILMRAGRGCGVRGLQGILPKRPIALGGAHVLRPLLDVRHSDAEAYLRRLGQTWREDSSNQDLRFRRNRLRAALAQMAPDAAPIVARMARLARNTAKEMRRTMSQFVSQFAGTTVSREMLLELHPAIRYEVYWEFAMQLRALLPDRRTTSEIEEAIAHEGGGRDLRGGWRVEVRGDAVEFRRAGLPPCLSSERYWPVAAPGETALSAFRRSLTARIEPGGLAHVRERLATRAREEEWIDADRVVPPIVVRRRRRGDRFHPLGASGEQKLKKFLIDHKVPRGERDDIPLVCDQQGILWVVGQRMRHSARVTEATTRLLCLRMERDS